MRIGLISDTHCPQRCPHYPATLGQVFRAVDLILHAGDVGELWVLEALGNIAPVVAVHGNDETDEAQRQLPFEQIVSVEGRRLLLSHGHETSQERELEARAGDAWPPKLERRLKRAKDADAEIFIHGHTHIPMCWTKTGLTLINPGAIASCNAISRQVTQTVAILDIAGNGSPRVRHIDLSKPDAPFDPRFDVKSGFRNSLARFSESIAEPEIENCLTRDWLDGLEDFGAFRACCLRLSHECWRGERQQITVLDVIAAVRNDPKVTNRDKERCEAVFTEM